MKKIGVIGAGIMGQGVAYQFAKFDYEVCLIDISQEVLDDSKNKIRNISRLDMLVNREKGPINPTATDNIRYSTDLRDLADADFIVENIIENVDAKTKVYQELSEIIQTTAKVVVNTSCITITRIGSLMKHPENVLGIHFMNPVHMRPTVEVIRGVYTSDESIETALKTLESVNMNGIVVNDSPGFVSNRVLMLTVNEAIFALQDRVADAESIDRIHKECFGHTMGPLETADLIGLDTILYSVEVLYHSFNDSKYRPAPLLKQMVDAGKLGRKSGEGFFKY
ncbi:MAG: 3-hydroxyacyl-CoA dehydrogenase family protein [Bacteroidetes bacterium]|nr:MAG: 3-hydroxyacyl-CoA dehydrogenase family protein [Bacteroidota bacterium]